MEWMAVIGNSIQYIEAHITEPLTIETIARAVNVSPFYFQKGFALLCGFTVSEYIRNRRLALAGNDLAATDEKVIDIALCMTTIRRTASPRPSPAFTALRRRPRAETAYC